MGTATTRIVAGNSDYWYPAHEFCTTNFGKGGVQKGRRWFAKLITPVKIEVYQDRSWGSLPLTRHIRQRSGEDYTVVYFRDPADAVWFRLKFGADHGNV